MLLQGDKDNVVTVECQVFINIYLSTFSQVYMKPWAKI
jgi:hypothetical protein